MAYLSGNKICFTVIGYIEPRKGQDILLEAISLIPQEQRDRCMFYFVGQKTSTLAKEIERKTSNSSHIVLTGTVDREGIHKILDYTDILVCPSREDPMPTVVAEAMAQGVVCLVSDAIGTAQYIRDGIDGFLFESENSFELAKKMSYCIQNIDSIKSMSSSSKAIYDEVFSEDVFEKKFIELVKSVI